MNDQETKEWVRIIHTMNPGLEDVAVAILPNNGVEGIFGNEFIEVLNENNESIGQHECSNNQETAERIVRGFQERKVPARLKTTKLVECGVCSYYHPADFTGDCRDDTSRFQYPIDPEDIADSFDDPNQEYGRIYSKA